MKNGFTLLELSIVTLIVGVLLAAITSNCVNLINRATFQATVREMGSIAQAAIDYYNSSNNPNDPNNPKALAWPQDITQLGGPYMPRAITYNPFGKQYLYVLSFLNKAVTVTTIIPKGILIDNSEGSFLTVTRGAAGDQISITRNIPNEFSGRLSYDLKYLYKQ